MRVNVILRYVGMIMLLLAFFMFVSAGISYVNHMDSAFYPLLLSALLTALLGGFPLIFVEKQDRITNKEGFCIVVGSWLLACVVGMFPYLIWGGEFSVINAWFETVSGFTTTGSSILQNVEALPRGLQFWRMSSTWVGGMGVVMFALVILPALGTSKMMLSSVEMSTLARDNYRYRAQMVVQILLFVYVGLTIFFTFMLKFAGMNWFDAVCHSMSACATSGFGTKNTSVAFYDSAMIDMVLIFAMGISGIHFGLIYATVTGKRNNIFRSEVTLFYLGMLILGSLLIALSLYIADIYPTFRSSLRFASFQFVSVTSTSGFATADSSLWTPFAIILLTGLVDLRLCGFHLGWYEGQSSIDGSEDALHPGAAAAASECRHPAQDGRCDSGSGRAAYGVAFHRGLPASHSHRNDSLYAFRRRSDDQFFGVRGFYRQCRSGIWRG